MTWHGTYELTQRIYNLVVPDPIKMQSTMGPWIERDIEDSAVSRSQIKQKGNTLMSTDAEALAESSLVRIGGVSLASERLLMNGKLVSKFWRQVLKKRGCLQTIRLSESKEVRPVKRTLHVCECGPADYIGMVFDDRIVVFHVNRMRFEKVIEKTLLCRLLNSIQSAVDSAALSHDRDGVTQMEVNTLDIIKQAAPDAITEDGRIETTDTTLWFHKKLNSWVSRSSHIPRVQTAAEHIAHTENTMQLGHTFFVQPINFEILFVHAVDSRRPLADELIALVVAQKQAEQVFNCLCLYNTESHINTQRVKNAFNSMPALDKMHKDCVLQALETHTSLKNVMSAYLDQMFTKIVSVFDGCRL